MSDTYTNHEWDSLFERVESDYSFLLFKLSEELSKPIGISDIQELEEISSIKDESNRSKKLKEFFVNFGDAK